MFFLGCLANGLVLSPADLLFLVLISTIGCLLQRVSKKNNAIIADFERVEQRQRDTLAATTGHSVTQELLLNCLCIAEPAHLYCCVEGDFFVVDVAVLDVVLVALLFLLGLVKQTGWAPFQTMSTIYSTLP